MAAFRSKFSVPSECARGPTLARERVLPPSLTSSGEHGEHLLAQALSDSHSSVRLAAATAIGEVSLLVSGLACSHQEKAALG